MLQMKLRDLNRIQNHKNFIKERYPEIFHKYSELMKEIYLL